ncbi:hypothetical protein VNO77_02082 [Canavalia gladiata]|uniref:Uncharacterized protein n=1 Tax=Canavalia gladiata TaxID=3824 RepID=A0AAN9MT35_CANGL
MHGPNPLKGEHLSTNFLLSSLVPQSWQRKSLVWVSHVRTLLAGVSQNMKTPTEENDIASECHAPKCWLRLGPLTSNRSGSSEHGEILLEGSTVLIIELK